MPIIFNFVIVFIISNSLTQAQWSTPEPGSHSDTCFQDTEFDTSDSYCFDSSVIGDGRDELYSTSKQCRILCKDGVSQFFDVSSKKTDCGFCRNDTLIADYIVFPEGVATQEDICIPRGVCIDQCGPEGDGCIYSGTCETLFCFTGKNSDKPAYISRATHAGPGTVLTVQVSGSGKSSFNATIGKWDDLDIPDVIDDGADLCIHHGTFATTSSNCLFADLEPPITDGRIDWDYSGDSWEEGQCRAFCNYFDRDKFEVERLQTRCAFCSQEAANSYFKTTKDGENMVCIPYAKCIEQCGPPRPGCWYTGSCESQICMSSMASKRPVVFTKMTDTGYGVRFTVNHSLPAIGIDPPMFSTSGGRDAGTPSRQPDVTPTRTPTKPISTRTPISTATPTPKTASSSPPADSTPSVSPPAGSTPPASPRPTISSPSGGNATGNRSATPTPGSADTPTPPCVAMQHLRNHPPTRLVFPAARRAPVLCDGAGSCATAGHIVVWGGRAMRMGTYCRRVAAAGGGGAPCVRRVTWVNSPRYGRGARVASRTTGLEFTAFAARYGTRAEEAVFEVLVRAGL